MIETMVGLDKSKLLEKFPKAIESKRMDLIKAHRVVKAWEWLIQNDLEPKFRNMEIVHGYLSDYIGDLYVHILINRREDMQPYLDLFLDDNNWELYNEDRDLAERVGTDWNKGPYIGYNFNPTEEYITKINKEFGGKLTYLRKEINFSQYQFDVYLYFFPAEDGECVITDLGKVERTIKDTVFEVTCKEGSKEELFV